MECSNALHEEGVNSLCRVCEAKVTTKDCKYRCTKFSAELLKCFAVDISSDFQHPKFFCKDCKRELDRFLAAQTQAIFYRHGRKVVLWGGFPCLVCKRMTESKKGGRKASKRKLKSTSKPVNYKIPRKSCVKDSCITTKNLNHQAEHAAVVTLLKSPCDLFSIPEFDTLVARAIKEKIRNNGSDEPLDFGGTGGRHIKLLVLPSTSKSTKNVCKKTKKNRSKLMNKVRHEVSGGDTFDQLCNELKILKKEDYERIFSDRVPKIPPTAGLDLKIMLSMPWNRLRILRRVHNSWNMHIPHEGSDRQFANQLLPFEVQGQMLGLIHRMSRIDGTTGHEIRLSQCASVPMLPLIKQHVQSHIKQGTFINNHPIIPNDKIYIKIGCDKGGGSMKFTFQILNVANPNSKENTVIFNLFEAPDSYTNIKTALDNNLAEINVLDGSQIAGKTCCVFLTGDYYGLTTFYGLSGAAGVYFCLYCLCTKSERQLPPNERNPPGPAPSRTLTEIRLHNHLFEDSGSLLSNAKDHFNCIHPPLFNIPIERVCPPHCICLLVSI